MTAIGLQIVTLAFPDPDIRPVYSSDFDAVPSNLSYTFEENDKIRTLSTTAAGPGRDIDGLLFHPTLPPGACPEAADIVPANTTTASDLPNDRDIFWVAIAPWINPNCTQAYFAATHNTGTQAMLFYLNDGGTDTPPAANDRVWALGDGGRWKSNNKFPVYAVPSVTGKALMQELSNYHGNVTDVPNGHMLANMYPSSDYIRLAAEINLGSQAGSVPTLWMFLLIILGILILIIGITSLSMHIIQKRRRDRLRRRVATGEVDLEALGIKRLVVPQEIIDQMPSYTYTDSKPEVPGGPGSKKDSVTSVAAVAAAGSSSEATSSRAPTDPSHRSRFQQATCPICLDDYEPGETTVRELPCHHLFHPECIDSFLRQNSSLCPMCKKSALPNGYVPAMITNAMVRRERMVMRIRERGGGRQSSAVSHEHDGHQAPIPRVRDAVRAAVSSGRRVFSAPTRTGPTETRSPPAAVEMRSTTNPLPSTNAGDDINRPATATSPSREEPCAPSPEPQSRPPNMQGRREWARQRAVSMLGNRRTAEDTEIDAEARRAPVWRRAVGRVWPGMA